MTIIASTPRLLLRTWRPDDAPALLALYSDPEVTRFIPHVRLETIEQAQAKVAQMGAQEITLWAVEREGELVGVCGFRDRWELGFAFRRDSWGKGYAREAAEACLAWAEERGATRVIARTREGNLGSRRVLDRLGFADTGERSDDGAWWTWARSRHSAA